MKIGFVRMPLTGHVNPMTALARRLQRRGHEIVFLGFPDTERSVLAAGLNFVSFGEEEFPVGSVAKAMAPVSKLHGLAVAEYSLLKVMPYFLQAALEHLPAKLAATGVEALVIDSVYRFVELICLKMNLPYVQVWNILNVDGSGTTPACFYSWAHETSPEAFSRNIAGLQATGRFHARSVEFAKSYADKNGVAVDWSDFGANASKLGW